jgi:rod shape determining protein RodA
MSTRNRINRRQQAGSEILGRIDPVAFSLLLSLVVVGWLMVFSVGYEELRNLGWDRFLSTGAGKQALWIGICAMLFTFIMLIDWKAWQTFAFPIYAFALLLLVLVLFIGADIKGNRAWFAFGGFSFQPAEFAKFGTALALSAFLSGHAVNLKYLRSQLAAFGIIAAPVMLIMLQPDAGSALVFLSFTLVLFRAGLSPMYYIFTGVMGTLLILGLIYDPLHISVGLLVAALLLLAFHFKDRYNRYWISGAALAAVGAYLASSAGFAEHALVGLGLAFLVMGVIQWQQNNGQFVVVLVLFLLLGSSLTFASNYGFNNILKPHQQDRINVWLQPEKCDEKGSLYNLIQSKTAIGSGGLDGKGFLAGTMTKGSFVPEQETDFIFCTIGEEQGFVGSFGVIALFFLLLIRLVKIAERQSTTFARFYSYSVAGIIFVHVFVNIGMTMGLMPIIGIPLPFISKGGSSLLGFTLLMAVLLKLDKHRK